uniref:Uncharacterized protein YyaB-like PH domain-containing protein n=1 Tax=Archaeoglobus fulgidus TaxID=2234 RepID=A0A7J2TL80_ARCFL
MLMHEDKPEYDAWMKITLSFAPSVIFLLLFLIHYNFIPSESEEEAKMGEMILMAFLGVILFLYWAILPRKYEIHEDKVRIVLGAFSYSIDLKSVEEVKRAESWKVFAYKGLRFATSAKKAVEIKRRKWPSVVISPSNPELFIERLQQALKKSKD